MGAGASAAVIWRYADIQYGFLDQELGYDNLHALAAHGRHAAVLKHLKQGMDPNARRLEGALGADDDERGDSPMICAARGALGKKDQPRHVKTLEVLLHFGARIDQPNLLNQTPLYIACERNLLRVATWLLQHGAGVNINCKTGVSPLMCAFQNQNSALATMLLEKGAVVIRPRAAFSYIKFPELADELEAPESPKNEKEAAKLRSTLQQYVDRAAEHRAHLIEVEKEAQRLEDQRVYREQLAHEGSKHKVRRRRQRLEAQQRRNLPPINALGPAATNDIDIERDDEHEIWSNDNHTLLWEMKEVVSRSRSNVSSKRPRWVARQIHCTQQSQNHRAESEHDFIRQCTKLYDSLAQERSRRMNARSIVLAPANPAHA